MQTLLPDDGPVKPKARSIFARRILPGMVALLVIALIVAAAALIHIARKIDQDALQQSHFLVGKALQAQHDWMNRSIVDYAFWGDAYVHLNRQVDLDWAYTRQNFGPTLYHDLGFDGVFVISPAGRTVYSLVAGRLESMDARDWLGEQLAPLVQEVRSQAGGKAISLGGRSMDPNARAKYLNGPETDLFDKGRSLFNQAPAREAAGKGLPLIVAEGYMDVIALSEAGFKAAVAPLGTAVTEDQLRLLWKIADEPIIALDGDAAGIRAALRVIDLALPLLEAGKGLRFAVLPGGMDPDDLIKAQGPAAMQKVLDEAQPV